jgi:hypothetical protein
MLFSAGKGVSQITPQLEFADNKVWVKNLDEEALYTFLRYNDDTSDWKEVFPVATKESEGITIEGEYQFYNTSVSFTPRFPLVNGVEYSAVFHLDELTNNHNEIYLPKFRSQKLELGFSLVPDQIVQPAVQAIYPSSNVLPENQLKFHIAFKTSMTLGEIYKRVKLINAKGKEIDKAFLILDQELWDNDMKVVTLLLDPGRIKRGLRPNMEMGTALKRNEQYTLVVEPGWKDVNGNLTKDSFKKVFTCAPADRTMPDYDRWEFITPTVSTNPLIIELKDNFDFIMLNESFIILDSRGHRVNGKMDILNNESTIVFTPENKWSNEDYTLYINPLLEDFAGNNLNRLFDEDLKTKEHYDDQKVIEKIFSVQLIQN